MADARKCPKCSGTMTQGRTMKYNEMQRKANIYMFFTTDDESGPDLSNILSGKPLSKSRKALAAFCCDSCGFTEFYGLNS